MKIETAKNITLTSKMELLKAKPIRFTEVIKRCKKENKFTNETIETNRTLYLLSTANNFFGEWISAEIPKTIFQKIVLPHHKHSLIELVSKRGSTLKHVISKLQKIQEEYRIANKDCMQAIESFKVKEITTVYLSFGALADLTNKEVSKFKEYIGLHNKENSLVHLDGLHKLLWLGLNNYERNIKVIVACKKGTLANLNQRSKNHE